MNCVILTLPFLCKSVAHTNFSDDTQNKYTVINLPRLIVDFSSKNQKC